MRRLLFSFLLGFVFFTSKATHIVGGGFDYRPAGSSNYIFRLTLYFDAINGSPGAKDETAICHIFSKANNQLVESLELSKTSDGVYLPFTNPLCSSNGFIRTEVLVYEAVIPLLPANYSNPQGYYIIWERCCRNQGVTNIQEPGAAGQTFYMEFPPVIKDGVGFANTSPSFLPINSDYPCVNEFFTLSFAATDPNGDSLSFSLVDPLKGNATATDPKDIFPVAAPYPVVGWNPGYNALNAIPGSPTLEVDGATGLLTCRPNQQGLFVFSVRCEEFRNGEKIGEVRREMQLLVKDCEANTPPVLGIQNENGGAVNSRDTLYLSSMPGRKCYKYKISEKQFNQLVKLRVQPLNSVIPNFFKDTTLSFSATNDTVTFNFCIPSCTVTPLGQPWRVLMIATDNGCPAPKSDTLDLSIVINQDILQAPKTQLLNRSSDTLYVLQTEQLKVQYLSKQEQNGQVVVTSFLEDSLGNPVPISINGIELPVGSGTAQVLTTFNWPEICFLPEQQPLKLITIATTSVCTESKSDTSVSWIYIVPKNPEVRMSSEYPYGNTIQLTANKSVGFNITGTASENRLVALQAMGSLAELKGFSFPAQSDSGSVTSPFRFQTDCSTPAGQFLVKFEASNTFCHVLFKDTLSYILEFTPDIDSLGLVPNLLTNNEDGRNDGLSLEGILPQDNCFYSFDFIEIYNRWGTKVFFSKDRNFLWKPKTDEEGVYFFSLHFKEKTITDWILVSQ